MFGRKECARLDIIKHLDTSAYDWCNEAVLISVADGKGSLALKRRNMPDGQYWGAPLVALTLNNIPLMQARLPWCPTTEGLLAAGYGIENADCAELKAVGERFNSDYVDIRTSVDALTPLLALLQSGLYVIADCNLYPTDGNGHFFWDVPNELTVNPATAMAHTEDYHYLNSFPAFLYPSQSNAYFDEARVNFYTQAYSETKNWPRAVAYHMGEFMSVLLDGHHKVTAAALLGKEARCIEIIPLSAMGYKQCTSVMVIDKLCFSDIEVPVDDVPPSVLKFAQDTFGKHTDESKLVYKPSNLISAPWDAKYTFTSKYYPDLNELAESVSLGIQNISDALIDECLSDPSERNRRILRYIVLCLARKRDARAKKLALTCGKSNDPALKLASFQALSMIKNDPDVEDFFIEYLVYHEDKRDELKVIADAYWQ